MTTKQAIKKKAMVFCRDFIYSLRDAGYDIPEQKRVELEQFFKSHLLQSQIRLIDSWIEQLKMETPNFKFRTIDAEYYVQCTAYQKALEDQISSLEEVKKELTNNF